MTALQRLLIMSARSISIAVGTGLGALLVLAAGFFGAKQIDINSDRLRWLIARSPIGDLAISWDDAHLSLERHSWLSKKIQLSARGLCVRWRLTAVDACFDQVRIGATLGLRNQTTGRWFDVPERIAPIELLGGSVEIDLAALPAPNDRPAAKVDKSPRKLIQTYFPRWETKGSRVEIRKLTVASGQHHVRARLSLEAKSFTPNSLGELSVSLQDLHDESEPQKVASLFLTAARRANERPWSFELSAHVTPGPGRRISLEALAQAKTFQDIEYQIASRASGLPPLKQVRLKGSFRDDRVAGRLTVTSGTIAGVIKEASFADCAYEAGLQQRDAKIHCGSGATVLTMLEELAPEALRGRRELLELRPSFELSALNIDFDKTMAADLRLSLALRQAGLLQASMEAEATIRGSSVSTVAWAAKAEAQIVAPDFAHITRFLRDTPYATPAPLNKMRGPIRLSAKADLNEHEGRIPFVLKLGLSSPDQRLHATANGGAFLAHAPSGWTSQVHVGVKIDDILLAAPRVDLQAPPQLLVDSRFREGTETTSVMPSTNGPRFSTEIETSSLGALKIATSMTPRPAPISVALETGAPMDPRARAQLNAFSSQDRVEEPGRLLASVDQTIHQQVNSQLNRRVNSPTATSQPSALSGSVSIGRTPILFMRRQAQIESLRVDFLPNKRRRITGRISITYPEYDIVALITGHADSPQLRFESTPPLPQDQILAALLFGRPLNELSDDERSSAANMNAAIADAALSVSSLYFLADTPIQSVGYDADRGLVTADIGLGGGNTLELGRGSSGASSAGVRRRLTRDIMLNTYVERSGLADRRTVGAFVEWVKRF